MLPISETREINQAAIVSCPLKDFKPRRALPNCPPCPYFDGLAVMGVEGNWSERYAIRCKHPIERRTQSLEVIED